MKNLIFSVSFLFLLLSACTKEESPLSTATITEQDSRRCTCCGGWFVEIEGEVLPLRFLNPPQDSELDLNSPNTKLPIEVELTWSKDENACMGDEIILTALRKK